MVELCVIEVPLSQRQDLLVKKLNQCQVLFDFNDPSACLESKNIKQQALQEMLHYVGTTHGAVPESIYPEVVRMVTTKLSLHHLSKAHSLVYLVFCKHV